jgi:hypothetical protein|tara:strand:- start:308 stop:499 length:192 start_codon:yes stop_codon:yes gene_type:complete
VDLWTSKWGVLSIDIYRQYLDRNRGRKGITKVGDSLCRAIRAVNYSAQSFPSFIPGAISRSGN